ncbi:PASTA domain-containing protein [Nocardioides ungokensis]|uniref:PASTA domain-containing protein n=1 Tax=Nocardioides ungokensis TaxID=1643322 RepID=UPI0015DF9095|nr:PASTA domain-containing protein [Nocardioides ungokensis]
MTEKTPATLDRLWDDIPTGHAPIGDLLTAGRAAKRRQRRTAVGSVAAATVLTLGVGALGTQVLGGGQQDHSGMVADGTVPGTRLVGIGHVAVAVPTSWADNAASCNGRFEGTVYFGPQGCVRERTWQVSSVAIATHAYSETPLDDLQSAGRMDGHQVVENAPNCLQAFSTSGNTGSTQCMQTFAIPDLDAYFAATVLGDNAESRLAAIRRSLTVLPDDQVTVPYVKPGSTPDDARAALEKAGLASKVATVACLPNAYCGGGVTGVEPGFGSVVPTGSAVTVTVLVQADTRDGSCGPNDLCVRMNNPANLPTSNWRPGDPSMLATGAGLLSVDNDSCPYLAGPGNSRTYVIWPAGYTAAIADHGTLVISDSTGIEVARAGDRVTASGGYTSTPTSNTGACPATAAKSS